MGWLLILGLSCFSTDQYILYTADVDIVNTFAVGPPLQKTTWKEDPRIRICRSTEVDIFRMQKAIKFWEMLGYNFERVSLDEAPNCMNPRYGEIIVTLPEGNINHHQMAATRIYTEKGTGYIAKAKIFVYPKYASKERVMEHELGHALGWQHHRQKFHIMNPSWHQGGYAHSGLRQ